MLALRWFRILNHFIFGIVSYLWSICSALLITIIRVITDRFLNSLGCISKKCYVSWLCQAILLCSRCLCCRSLASFHSCNNLAFQFLRSRSYRVCSSESLGGSEFVLTSFFILKQSVPVTGSLPPQSLPALTNTSTHGFPHSLTPYAFLVVLLRYGMAKTTGNNTCSPVLLD